MQLQLLVKFSDTDTHLTLQASVTPLAQNHTPEAAPSEHSHGPTTEPMMPVDEEMASKRERGSPLRIVRYMLIVQHPVVMHICMQTARHWKSWRQ